MPKIPKLFNKNKRAPYSPDVHPSTSTWDYSESEFSDSDQVSEDENILYKKFPLKESVLNEIVNQVKSIKIEDEKIENNLKKTLERINQPNKMTTITVIDLIKNLNNFDGTPGTLNRFLRNANRIITTAGENPATIEMVTDMVRNKIVGKANEILISVGDPSAWNLISEHLKTQFSDRRTVETILHKLNTISQNNKSLELY